MYYMYMYMYITGMYYMYMYMLLLITDTIIFVMSNSVFLFGASSVSPVIGWSYLCPKQKIQSR